MTPLDSLIQHVILVLVTLGTPFAMLLVHKVINKLAEKFHLDNVAKYSAQVDDLVYKAINGVEKAAQSYAAKEGSPVKRGEDKLREATTWVNSELARLHFDPIDVDKLAVRVEAALLKYNPGNKAPTKE